MVAEYSRYPIFDQPIDCSKNPFHYPRGSVPSFERRLATDTDEQEAVWCALRTETAGKAGIDLFRFTGKEPAQKYHIEAAPGSVGPSVCAGGDAAVYVAWTQCEEGRWSIVLATKEQSADQVSSAVVFTSSHVCIHVALCWYKGSLWIAWSGIDAESGKMAVYVMERGDAGNRSPLRVVGGRFNAFRPSLAAAGRRLFVCCDVAHDGVYEIAWLRIDEDGSAGPVSFLGRAGERWMEPTATAGPDGKIHAAFVVIRDVIDKEHGIVDHEIGAAYVKIDQGGSILMPDDSIGDGVRAAMLREGLLGRETYVAYFGSRRKVYPVVLPDGRVWILWEFRYEQDRSSKATPSGYHSNQHYGWLAGRELTGTKWGELQTLHNGGTLYSVPATQRQDEIVAACVQQSDISAVPETRVCVIKPPDAGTASREPVKGWDRWRPLHRERESRETVTVATADGEYNLYWADSHVHSHLSPDAEGEPDELILFARDIAGVDAMAMVDNDYYPHKAFTVGEWNIQQALSELFTESGRFVVLPGYEYTFHNPELDPDFNHRYILYPRGGDLHRRIDEGSRVIEELAERLRRSDGLMFAHHPSWVLTGREYDRNVEVCSSWRVCIEEKDFIIERLKAGDRFGFVGSSDTHRAVPGLGGALTGIFARALTPEALFDAYRNRRTVATQGTRTLIDFTAGGVFIGGEGVCGEAPLIKLHVKSPEPLEFVEIIRDGEAIRRLAGSGKELFHEFVDESALPGTHFYFVRVKGEGDPSFNEYEGDRSHYNVFVSDRGVYRHNFARARGPFAWSSPVWLEIVR